MHLCTKFIVKSFFKAEFLEKFFRLAWIIVGHQGILVSENYKILVDFLVAIKVRIILSFVS